LARSDTQAVLSLALALNYQKIAAVKDCQRRHIGEWTPMLYLPKRAFGNKTAARREADGHDFRI